MECTSDRELSHLGAENLAGDADNVTDVILLVGGVGLLTHNLSAQIDLDIPPNRPAVRQSWPCP